jgi:hypothetical protein
LLVIFLSFFIFNNIHARNLKLLEIPLDNGRISTYSVNQIKYCSFEGIYKIQTSELELDHRQNKFIEKINLLQRKLNYKVTHPKFSSNIIAFSLSSASNIIFEFSLDNCQIKKNIRLNENSTPFDEVDIEYGRALNSPVIKKMTIIGDDNYLNIFLYPWALQGQISTYELSAGLAFELHSNIRFKNLNSFQKKDPVLEPIPALLFRYGPFFLSKDGIGSLLFHSGNLTVIGMGILEGEPYKTYGLNDRSKGVYLGSILKYYFFEFTYYNDFFKDKGLNLKFKINPEIYSSMDWKLSPQIFLQYWNTNYVMYYFGVNTNESAKSLLPRYQGKQTYNYGTIMEGIHYVANWSYIIDIGFKKFGKEVYSSPTIINKTEFQLTTAVVYKFF